LYLYDALKEDTVSLPFNFATIPVALLTAISITAHAEEVPRFVDYPGIRFYQGPHAAPALSDMCKHYPAGKVCPSNGREQISKGAAKDGVHFNGAFTLISWGCGTDCQIGVAVDRTNGAIYPLPDAVTGYEFSIESSLLIVNPNPSDYWDDVPAWLSREFHVFRNGSFRLVSADKGPDADRPHTNADEEREDQEFDRQECLAEPDGELC
jgi:hypothetical protein